MPAALSQCLVLNTIAAARALLREGDARFKPFGVTVQQFSLLAAIRFHPEEPVKNLAARISLDRTSLTRNLDLLEKRNLIRRVTETVGNMRICVLTESGNALLDVLLVEWQQTQAGILKGFSPEEAGTYVRIAKHFAKL
jgi:DNA-binding MarR family transcriptional regulator